MRHGSLVDRVMKGSRWVWTSADYRAALPVDLDESVLEIESSDRHHAKQGRSTARVRFDSPWGPLTVYLKRHLELPWKDRLAAMILTRRAGTRPARPSGPTSRKPARWGSACPTPWPRASGSAPGEGCKAS